MDNRKSNFLSCCGYRAVLLSCAVDSQRRIQICIVSRWYAGYHDARILVPPEKSRISSFKQDAHVLISPSQGTLYVYF